MTTAPPLPLVDVEPLLRPGSAGARAAASARIRDACRAQGFFYAVGHGVAPSTLAALEAASRAFFALPEPEKRAIEMARAGRAWRGYFPLGGELTAGRPDRKEGVYFGVEHAPDDPRVLAGVPLHGANLYPAQVPALRPAVEAFMAEGARAAQAILEGVARALDLDDDYFRRRYTHDPTVLFRVFHYPAVAADDPGWGVGEHTDYGLLTLLATDGTPGLQVKTPAGWVDAPPVEGALVCNLGDMLDRLTGGWFRSTPHRVRNVSGRSRLSFPLFFDPAMSARIEALPRAGARPDVADRWDGADVHAPLGTYGEYLLAKVGRVFPDLGAAVL